MMKTTRRGLFGIFGGAAAVVATKQLKLPETVVDTTTFETVGYGVLPVNQWDSVSRYADLSDIVTVTLKNNVRQLADNISRNNPLFERLNSKGRIHKLKKT